MENNKPIWTNELECNFQHLNEKVANATFKKKHFL